MSDEIRYGFIGCGMMGQEHVRNVLALPGARVTALADPHGPSIEQSVRVLADPSGVTIFEDHRDLLASGLCDAVVVATPNMTHAAVLLDVLETPLPVLVEKPLCTTVADCRTIVAAAQGRPGLVWVGLEYRYMPPVARLVEVVRDGGVGRVRMVAIREHRFPFLPKVGDWNRFARNTGGTLVEKCCHFFDLMNHITCQTPVRVLASGAQDVNHLDERYDGEQPDIIDNAYVIVEYDRGARALLDLCMFAEASEHQEELSVVGDRGKVEAFLPSSEVRWGTRTDGRAGVHREIVRDEGVGYEGFHHGSSYLEHVEFLAAVREASSRVVSSGAAAKTAAGHPGIGPEDGLLSVAIGVAAQTSIDEGRPVLLDDVLAAV
ncbi:MAG: Gfo/Idh/MocA family oxidoreductase [Acidimicrobiia bacterium]|nr:Gfo/Idh/MocA family oxidoreductase [Acidimicrobiia bacterium]